ncbi:MAG TPA: SUMF1/EgtB/PvdO family nonheme iron enzyme [Thermoanaerobaculia bacterium]|nr:SUMF1/EgtB/PvdO family nonheme iron enzyme [Thermoanaerobaculia bacterium]
MSEPFSLVGTVLSAALQGAVEGAAGKLTEGPAGLLLEKVREWLGGAPKGSIEAAVERAVEAAARKAEKASPSLVVRNLLEDRAFLEEVQRMAVYGGRPDLASLRQAYLVQAGSKAEAPAEIEHALESFFEAIQLNLELDPEIGSWLRDTQYLVRLAKLEATAEVLAASSLRAEGQREAQLEVAKKSEGHLERLARRAGAGPLSELTAEEKKYLRLLRDACDQLPLAEDRRDTDRPRASLARVYVDLATGEPPSLALVLLRLGVPAAEQHSLGRDLKALIADLPELKPGGEEATLEALVGKGPNHPLRRYAPTEEALREALAPRTALETLSSYPRLVLLGDPGSGKSTFVQHLAGTLAGAWLGEEPLWRETLAGAFEESPFPIRIVLRRWGAALTGQEKAGLPLLDLALSGLEAPISADRLAERFEQPGTLLLLDGLDEVPVAKTDDPLDRRRLLLDSVQAFLTAYPRCRVLLTSRSRPYLDPHRLPGVPVARLARLDGPRVASFIERWYEEQERIQRLTPTDARRCRERLGPALERPALAGMAGSPLLLTMLARVNARTGLPEGRAELYRECVDQLLWEWEKAKGREGAITSLDTLLEEIAPERKRVDLERVLWQTAFEAHGAGGDGSADVPIRLVRERLAAIHPRKHEGWAWADRVVTLIAERGGLLNEAVPEETFNFAHRSFQEYLAARWLLQQEDVPAVAGHLAGEEGWYEVVLLACGHLASVGEFPQRKLLLEVIDSLTTEPVSQQPPAVRRTLLAGRAWLEHAHGREAEGSVAETWRKLGKKLPPRLTKVMQGSKVPPAQRLEAGEILADLGILPDDLGTFVEIPADVLPYSFKIGKYPVTNWEYREFMEGGAEGARRPPLWPEPRYSRDTLPVVAISWDDALAYGAWKTARLRAEGRIGSEEVCTLPTVAEWQRAAGGVEGRTYPWGGGAESSRANARESGLERATPVHMYPQGASPEGVFDLAGNVWEWTADADEKVPQWKVLIGGSWWSRIENVGPAARDWIHPVVRYGSFGFRLVVVPSSRRRSDS